MKREHRRAMLLRPSCILPQLCYTAAAVLASCTAGATAAAAGAGTSSVSRTTQVTAASGRRPCSGFVLSPSRLRDLRCKRREAVGTVRAVQTGPGSCDEGESRRDGIAVHDESWYLGDGGFAERHLEDEGRVAAKKTEKEFFRERSLSVYDQMKEASMLLLAQQQVLAAEEARDEASKPRFVASAGDSQSARAQAARDRQKRREAVAGLLPDAAGSASSAQSSGSAAAVMVPTGPGLLSGDTLGVGGLDEELEEIRRRVCVPLAAPADLLDDLGISPVRGLLLYGPPGCGKTLLARRLSTALTSRPPTVVSGPEILERFVGSSEANIRALFDYPPDVPGASDEEQEHALHVIVMDEFDSIGQRRGGGDDGGDRVRDSVVNQLLARMDGFHELERPTLLVALTNRIDLLDSALLRPGRFEVQVQIPGPDQPGREAILRIHTQRMHEANRIDTPPPDRPAISPSAGNVDVDDGAYEALLSSLAAVTDGFTGAELAGLVRAAASYALERAVSGGDGETGTTRCRVTAEDFGRGLADVSRSKLTAEPSTNGARLSTTPTSAPAAEGRRLSEALDATSSAVAGGGEQRQGAVAKSKAVAAAAVAAARSEGEIDGTLSPEDLSAVQKLLLHKASQKEEDALLYDAAQVVAQRRRRNRGGGGEGRAQRSQQRATAAEGVTEGSGEAGAESSTDGARTLKTFEHTGWFHTYE